VHLWCEGRDLRAKRGTRDLDVCVGDLVTFSEVPEGVVVDTVLERKNCLRRSYGRVTKQIAANIDLLFVICAPKPLFNTKFVDRIIAAAEEEGITSTIVMNKIDLADELAATKDLLDVYEGIGEAISYISADSGDGLNDFRALLNNPQLQVVTFAGVSGVGKTTLLGALLPDADVRTQEVSRKTGQGRQTTSQSTAYRYEREGTSDLFIVDLPGIQNYGISHFAESQMRHAFVEFRQYDLKCRFSNCTHRVEPDCAVLKALAEGKVAQTRYDSYLDMLSELESFRDY